MRSEMRRALCESHREKPILFNCEGEHLLGILTSPADGEQRGDIGVVVVVGGPQYRVGSHRQFLHLSRSLAKAGVPVLRFDVRGMGDSTGEPTTFEDITPDICGAIGALQEAEPYVKRVVLWGLCDGASAALMCVAVSADDRISGLCLLNPWVRSAVSQAKTRIKHYYTRRLLQREFWVKFFRGGIAFRALVELATAMRLARRPTRTSTHNASFQKKMLNGLQRFRGSILLMLSGEDYTAKEFLDYVGTHADWQAAIASPSVQRADLAHANHTFSTARDRTTVEALTLDWLDSLR